MYATAAAKSTNFRVFVQIYEMTKWMWNVHTFRAFLLSARFVFFLYIYFMRPEDVRFIHAFCVYNLHFGTSKAMKDHFVFVTLQQLSQCIWNLFDLTWARSEIYHFLEPIRCDSFCEKESKIDAECVRENERIVGLTLALMFLFNKKKNGDMVFVTIKVKH